MKNDSVINLGTSGNFTEISLSPIPDRSPASNLGSGILHAPWTAVRGLGMTRDLTPSGSRERTAISPEGYQHAPGVESLQIYEKIAKGMAYLHNREVLRGDLKSSNVLVDDKYRCVIPDFGQSDS